jgi:hypothetical protein
MAYERAVLCFAVIGLPTDISSYCSLLRALPHVAAVVTADFLQPDEITFAVLLRGYGSQNPPAWQSIDGVLTTMKTAYGIEPTASKHWLKVDGCWA